MKKIMIVIALIMLVNIQAKAKTGLVPFDLAQKAAYQNAKSNWGEVAVGPYATYYDLEGKPAVYIFSYRLSCTGNFSEKEIYIQINTGLKLIDQCLTTKNYG